jgi:DNA-binding beta-propeller fold protein YncE
VPSASPGEVTRPTGAVVAGGTLYVVDNAEDRVDMYDISAQFWFGSFGSAGTGNGQFNAPTGIAANPSSGDVFVADQGNGRVQQFSGSGTYVAQSVTSVVTGSIGPSSVAVNPTDGSVYVLDTANDRVMRFVSSGSFLRYNSQFGGLGSGSGQFSGPGGIAFDAADGTLYASDVDRVQQFGVPAAPTCGANSLMIPLGTPAAKSSLSCVVPGGLHPFFQILSTPAHATLSNVNGFTGEFTYTPAPGFTGLDSFTFRAMDPGGVSPAQSVGITIYTAPTCQDESIVTHAGTPVIARLSCTDSTGAALTYTVGSQPAHGSLSQFNPASGQVVYTPAPRYSGADSFTYTATSSSGQSALRTVRITVNGAPVCRSRSVRTLSGVAVTVALACADATGAPITYSIVGKPAHGALGAIDQKTGRISYRPKAGYGGGDAFGYAATSANGTSTAAVVSITVKLLQINASLTWNFQNFKRYATVSSLDANKVPVGASVDVACTGKGCPQRRTLNATAPQRRCKNARHCKAHAALATVTVHVGPVFKGRHLRYGSKVTVAIVRRGWIGKIYVFSIEPTRPAPLIACLAPGATKPGKGC